MARKVTPVPKGYRTANPVLIVQGADAALSYYETAFGAEVLSRDYAQDGITILQAEMKIGNTIMRLADEMPNFGIVSPTTLGGSAVIVQLYLSDVDTFWDQVIDHGARVVVPLSNTYWGERFGRFVDSFGHVWNVAKRIEILTPGEVAKRAVIDFSVLEPHADVLLFDELISEIVEPTTLETAVLDDTTPVTLDLIDGTNTHTTLDESTVVSEPEQAIAL